MRRTFMLTASLATLIAVALTPSASHAATPTFSPSVKVGTGLGEPGITVMDDGTLLFDALQGAPSHSRLYRSTDHGTHWENLNFGTAFGRLPGGGDTSVAVRGDTVYFLDLWAGSNSISVSNDKGTTWAYGSPISSIPPTDRQWLALGPHDATTGLDTVYALYQQIGSGQNFVSVSHTSGVTWEEPLPAPSLGSSIGGFPGRLLSDGNQFLTYISANTNTLRSLVSTDGGVSWTIHPIAQDIYSGTLPGYARDPSDGTLWASWVHRGADDTDANNYSIFVASSKDNGTTWSQPLKVSDGGMTNMFTGITARNGKVGVVWYGTQVLDANSQPVLTDPNNTPDASVWNAYYAEYDAGTWTSAVKVDYAKKGNICTHGLNCPNLGSTGRELGDYLSVTFDQNNKALIAFGGNISPTQLRIAREL